MWWRKPKPELPLRDQLLAAKADLVRQLEILSVPPSSIGKGGAFIDNSRLIAQLQETLREVEHQLASFGHGDPIP